MLPWLYFLLVVATAPQSLTASELRHLGPSKHAHRHILQLGPAPEVHNAPSYTPSIPPQQPMLLKQLGLSDPAGAVGKAAVEAVLNLALATSGLPNGDVGAAQGQQQQEQQQPATLPYLGAPIAPSSAGSASSGAASPVTPTVMQGTPTTTVTGSSSSGSSTAVPGITVTTSTPVTVVNPISVSTGPQAGSTSSSGILGLGNSKARDALLLASAARPRVLIVPVFLPWWGQGRG